MIDNFEEKILRLMAKDGMALAPLSGWDPEVEGKAAQQWAQAELAKLEADRSGKTDTAS